MGFPEMKAAGA